MPEYETMFREFCRETGLSPALSFDMPAGYETAYGTYDAALNTVFINAALLENAPGYEKAFTLFHELRHAAQHLQPERFSERIIRSLPYVILYDGTCYKLVSGGYRSCRLEGTEADMTCLYLAQPYEADANVFAYEQTGRRFGFSEGLKALYRTWLPEKEIPDETFQAVYAAIDAAVGA